MAWVDTRVAGGNVGRYAARHGVACCLKQGPVVVVQHPGSPVVRHELDRALQRFLQINRIFCPALPGWQSQAGCRHCKRNPFAWLYPQGYPTIFVCRHLRESKSKAWYTQKGRAQPEWLWYKPHCLFRFAFIL